MQGHPKTIELLNQLLAEELSAADQYFVHAEPNDSMVSA